MSLQDAMSSKSKKRQLAEDDKLGNVISQSFDNVSMAINRMTEVMTKCFLKSYRAEVHAVLDVLDLDLISKTEAYIYFMENPIYQEIFGCPDHGHIILKKVWDFLANLSFGVDYVILFCFGKTHY